jgi:hypothetical protein
MPEETSTGGTAVIDAPQTTTAATVSAADDWDTPAAAAPESTPQATKPEAAEGADSRGTPQPDPEPSESSDRFDALLLAQATNMGFTEDEARAFGSNENLDKALARHEKLLIARGRAGQAAGRAPTPTPPTPSQPTQTTATPPAQAVVPPIDLAGLEEELGSKSAAVIRAMHEQNAKLAAKLAEYEEPIKRVGELDGWRAQMQQAAEAQARTADLQATAAVIDALPDEWKALAGKGPARDRVLNEVLDTALALANGIRADSPDAKLTGEALLQRAFRSVFADSIEEMTRAKIIKQVEARKAISSHPPTHRKAKEVADPVKRAENAVRERMIEMGFSPGTDD